MCNHCFELRYPSSVYELIRKVSHSSERIPLVSNSHAVLLLPLGWVFPEDNQVHSKCVFLCIFQSWDSYSSYGKCIFPHYLTSCHLKPEAILFTEILQVCLKKKYRHFYFQLISDILSAAALSKPPISLNQWAMIDSYRTISVHTCKKAVNSTVLISILPCGPGLQPKAFASCLKN